MGRMAGGGGTKRAHGGDVAAAAATAAAAGGAAAQGLSKEERKAAKKARKEARRAARRELIAAGDASLPPAARGASSPPPATQLADEPQSTVGPCNVCGRMGHLGRTCPTRVCRACGKPGHLAKHCPANATCSHCGVKGHLPKQCTFGAQPHERFLYCGAFGQPCGCFARRFLVPLRRAAASEIDPADLRANGRTDVGTGCVSSGLFLSQSMRGNASVTLAFGGDKKVIEVGGATTRGLRPDDASVAARLRLAARSPMNAEDDGFDASSGTVVDAERYSASLKRGFRVSDGTTEDALREMMASNERAGGAPPLLIMLDANGTPIEEACRQMTAAAKRGKAPASRGCGVVVLLGDDRGLHEDDERMAERVAQEAGSSVLRVSLGKNSLFSIHSIMIVNWVMDTHMHSCKLKAARDMGGRSG